MFEQVFAEIAALVLRPEVFIAVIAGVALGIFLGALPGLTTTLAVAVFSPLTFTLEPVLGISFLLGLYKGGTFGGSISAILLGTPGTASNAATAIDGFAMARKGEGANAIRLACYGSAVGDFFSNITLVLLAAPMAVIALKFGPPEILAVIVFSLLLVLVLSADDVLKGVLAALFGVLFATVGIDSMTGTFRFTFGTSELQGGVPFIAMMIGLFGVGEILAQICRPDGKSIADIPTQINRSVVTFLSTIRSYWRTILRSAGIGVGIGVLPGMGAETSCWVAYGVEKSRAKDPERFGKGAPEGVVAPEVASNSECAAALIPLLAFGIPGDVVTAVMLGAFIAQGLRPGPVLFQQNYDILYALYTTMFMCTVALIAITIPTVRFWARILTIPRKVIFSIVLVLCVVGTYSNNNSVSDVLFMLGFGVLGLLMRLAGFPVPPMVLAFVLAPMLEQSLQQSLILFGSGGTHIANRPIAITIFAITLAAVLGVLWKKFWGSRTGREGTPPRPPSPARS